MGTAYNEKQRGGLVCRNTEYHAIDVGTYGLRHGIGSSFVQHLDRHTVATLLSSKLRRQRSVQ